MPRHSICVRRDRSFFLSSFLFPERIKIVYVVLFLRRRSLLAQGVYFLRRPFEVAETRKMTPNRLPETYHWDGRAPHCMMGIIRSAPPKERAASGTLRQHTGRTAAAGSSIASITISAQGRTSVKSSSSPVR